SSVAGICQRSFAAGAGFFSWPASGIARNARNNRADRNIRESAFIIGWWCAVEIMIMQPPVKPVRKPVHPHDSVGLKARHVIAGGGARSAQPQDLRVEISEAL